MRVAVTLLTSLFVLLGASVSRGEEKELRELFDRFITAQNAHDSEAVADLLVRSPRFLWITPDGPVFGHRVVLKWFEAQYRGVWSLKPDREIFRMLPVRDGVVQLQVPVEFTTGQPKLHPKTALMTMNQIAVLTPEGWKIAGIWWNRSRSGVESGITVVDPKGSPRSAAGGSSK